jgi:hypothetical protein
MFSGCSHRRSEELIVIRLVQPSLLAALGLTIASVAWFTAGSFVQAQTGKTKIKPKPATSAEVKKLDAKLDEVQNSFLRETASLIKGYEDTGHPDRAKVLLEVLQKLYPKDEQIKKKIDQLNDQMLDQSEFELDLDPAKPWQQVGLVVKDRPMRIEVEGEYKFVASIPVGPDGFSVKDPATDLVGGAPLGAVIAVILPPGGAGNNGGGNQKPPNPFTVGTKLEQGAQRDGMLLMKVNVPPGSKCTGKLKVKVSGVNKAT